MSAPTSAQITALYKSTLNASKQFASYNFRNYFVLRTESHFKAPPSPPTISWYNGRVRELEVLRRSAITNRLYEGPRLVVEAGSEPAPEEGGEETLLEHIPGKGETGYTC